MNQNARYNCEKIYIQGDSGGIVNIFGDNGIGHCKKKVDMNTCLILN